MASRTDQLQSYQFLTQRVISALVMRETDPRQSPLRRGIGAVFAGLMIAIMVAAGFGVYGLLTKIGGNEWQNSGSVIVEKESGASFVYLNGVLHPTLNYTSAVLIGGHANQVFRVAAASLASVPRGTTMGIPDAPDSLPGPDKQVGLPWSSCVMPGVDGSGHPTNPTALAIDEAPSGGQQVGDQALLVKDADKQTTFLVWAGRRHLIRSSAAVVQQLYGSATATLVGTAWLNGLPAGLDVAPIATANLGLPSRAVSGRTNGDVLVQQTGAGAQYYLVQDDGILAITQFQLVVLGAAGQVTPIAVQSGEVKNIPKIPVNPSPDGGDLPITTPTRFSPGGSDSICASTAASSSVPTLSVGATLAGIANALPTVQVSQSGEALADSVVVPPGRVCVVRIGLARTDLTANYFVVTDTGIKYPLSAPSVLPTLGYSEDTAVDVPSALVNLLPTGPTLDPAAALQSHAPND